MIIFKKPQHINSYQLADTIFWRSKLERRVSIRIPELLFPSVVVWAIRAYNTAPLCLKHLNGNMTKGMCCSEKCVHIIWRKWV